MNDVMPDLRTTLERVRWEVMALLAKTRKLDLDTLYAKVREVLNEDTDLAVAGVISALLRAHVISLEPLLPWNPSAGMAVELV